MSKMYLLLLLFMKLNTAEGGSETLSNPKNEDFDMKSNKYQYITQALSGYDIYKGKPVAFSGSFILFFSL